ncbi:MAG: ATP-dependent DNA helicase [Opitutales bacterium]|nr:ATP-dependent DNA helicase [Opitutales bacterium]
MALTAEAALKQYFGFAKFRNPQDRIIASILSGRDTMAIMPTGGGKSLCYQLPAMILPHLTIVVSPLIALMKDQVDSLRAKGVPAASLNGLQSLAEQDDVFNGLRSGRYKIVYIAPERFRAERFVRLVSELEVSLFAIDEAHCLSQWGHDFRPDYLRLGEVLRHFRSRPVVAAFTATATPEVREDILKTLRLHDEKIFISGFARENLSFNIMKFSARASAKVTEQKLQRLIDIIDTYKTGIVYCATRKSVEKVYENLQANDVSAIMYHAGMSDAERTAAQEEFMEGRGDVVVATNAFGMGIDRSDIRFVVHYEMPGSIEAYYQEAGRAGRDGKPAVCELFYNYADSGTQGFFIEGANPSKGLIQLTYRILQDLCGNGNSVSCSLDSIADAVNADRHRYSFLEAVTPSRFSRSRGNGDNKVNPMAVSTAVGILNRYGYIDRITIPGQRVRETRICNPDVGARDLKISWEQLKEKRERDLNKLQKLIDLLSDDGLCRQEAILRYFGDPEAVPCGKCDVCRRLGISAQKSVPELLDVPRELDPEELLMVQKILSCVARLSVRGNDRDEWKPRFGEKRVVEVLTGSKAKAVLDNHLDQVSTYGILRKEGRSHIEAVMKALMDAGALDYETVEKKATGEIFKLCRLTPRGSRIMRGEESVKLVWPGILKKTEAEQNPGAVAVVSQRQVVIAGTKKKPTYSKAEKELLGGIAKSKKKKSGRKFSEMPEWLRKKIRSQYVWRKKK